MARARRAAVPAPGGSYVLWDHSHYVWFCLCRPIETTLPIGVWDQQRSRCEARRCETRRCEARRCEVGCLGPLLLCVVLLVQVPTGVWDQQRSRCVARRCEARRCEVRCLGPLLLCVVLRVQANRNEMSDRAMGPAAESTLSGIGLDWIGLDWNWIGLDFDCIRLGGIRVRGVRFAWRSFPNGLYQKKAKIDFGVS